MSPNINIDLKDSEAKAPGGGKRVFDAGWYRCMIVDSDYKPNKAETGYVIHLEFGHLDEPYRGGKFKDFINAVHVKEQVQEIGRSTLKALAIAVELPNPDMVEKTEDLHNKPLMVRLDQEEDDRWGLQNRVTGYLSLAGFEKEGHAAGPDPTATVRHKGGNGAAPASAPYDNNTQPLEDVPF